MTLEVLAVRSKRDFRRFVDLPWQLYDPAIYPLWVPPLRLMVEGALDERKNPFYQRASRELFLALRDGRVVGRIAAVENRAHNEFHADRVGFFGFFEVMEDQDAADALFATAAEWLGARGLDAMRGPMSPSTNHEAGLLVGGFEWPPVFMTAWNPPYYGALCEGAGLSKTKDLLAYHIPVADRHFGLTARYEQHAERALSRANLVFRDADRSKFRRELEICWDVYNSAWERNWGFVPMKKEEFVFMAKELEPLLIPELAYIAEIDGRPAGFVIAVPDFNHIFKRIPNGRLFPTGILKMLVGRRKLKAARVILLGVKPEFRSRGIFQLFVHELLRRGRANGFVSAEVSWVLEDNVQLIQPLEAFGAREYRRWRIYEKELGHEKRKDRGPRTEKRKREATNDSVRGDGEGVGWDHCER